MTHLRRTVDVLGIAAEDAARRGDEDLHRQLLSERDALRQAALNPRLWQERP
jgi:hypothetical protein